MEVKLQSLDLFAGPDAVESTSSTKRTAETETTDAHHKVRTYSAMMQFSVKVESEDPKEMNFALSYDVQFVTAHPCVPSLHTRLIQPASSLESTAQNEMDQPNRRPSGPHTLFTGPSSPLPSLHLRTLLTSAGHALHKSYNFSRHTFSSVVFASPNSPPPLLSLHTSSTEIFVIDCTEPSPPEAAMMEAHPSRSAFVSRKRRFGSDLEMLARAWCAEKGYNALISRRGRNCIACSIREARALSWKIVLRFG